jgi:exonuclease SbcC
MIPVELELENFLAYRQPHPLRLEGIHVACLAGPNGAGKSSLLDAITWAMWGRARGSGHDELIHQGQKEMRVALTFDQSGQRFKVIRQRKGGKRGSSLLEFQAWDASSETWSGISEGAIRETQAKIDEVVRLDYDTFVNSAFLVQGRADEFTTKTPTQRKQVLSTILGLSQWERYEDRAKDQLRSVQDDIQRLDGRLEEIERELSQRQVYEEEGEQAEQGAVEAAEKLEAAEAQWADLEGARAELVTLQRQIDDLTRRIVSRQNEIKEAQDEVDELEKRADKAAIQAALDAIKENLAALEPVLKQKDEIEKKRQALREEMANLTGVNQALGPETEPIKARLTVLQESEEPVCPTCGQPLEEDHRHELIQDLETDIEARRARYKDNRDRIRELEAELEEKEQQRTELEAQVAEKPDMEKRLGELEAAMSHASDAEKQLKSVHQRLDRWRKELSQDEEERTKLETQAEASEKALAKASLTQADVDQLRLEKRMADERVGGARQKLAALETFEKQRQDRVQERQAKSDDLGLYQELREAFSKRGVPAMIIETAVPELETSANDLLAQMTDGRMHVRIETQREIKTGELREALDIIISDELGSRPYELYSGGEAFRIDFAIRIALSKLLARRAGAQLRSLFIDEGFGTQDARGREHLISAINTIQDDFDLILVITHIEELKEAFPTRIEVEKTPEGSLFSIV